MRSARLIPVVLLAGALALLAGCGSSTSSRDAAGDYAGLVSATSDFANQGAKFALALQDCTNVAGGNAAAAACAEQELARVAERWAPVGSAADALQQAGSGACRQAIRKAVGSASLLNGMDASAPTTVQQAEALTTQITDDLQQFAQEIAAAKGACT